MTNSYVKIKPVNPTTPANSVHNDVTDVSVNVDHNSFHKAVTISACPCKIEPNGIVGIFFTAGEYATVEPMPRLNRKRLAILQSATRNELSSKTGRAWDLVQQLCQKLGYTTEV